MSVGIKANNQRPAPHFLDQLQRLSRIKEVSVVNMESPISATLTATWGTALLHLLSSAFLRKHHAPV